MFGTVPRPSLDRVGPAEYSLNRTSLNLALLRLLGVTLRTLVFFTLSELRHPSKFNFEKKNDDHEVY